jgi:hypothetical protein
MSFAFNRHVKVSKVELQQVQMFSNTCRSGWWLVFHMMWRIWGSTEMTSWMLWMRLTQHLGYPKKSYSKSFRMVLSKALTCCEKNISTYTTPLALIFWTMVNCIRADVNMKFEVNSMQIKWDIEGRKVSHRPLLVTWLWCTLITAIIITHTVNINLFLFPITIVIILLHLLQHPLYFSSFGPLCDDPVDVKKDFGGLLRGIARENSSLNSRTICDSLI